VILPCRRLWSSLAVVWLLLLVVNFSQREHGASAAVQSTPSAEMATTFKDQQKLLNELLADRSWPVDLDRPKNYLPKPRTEIANLLMV
jgi:hypothetical protein